MIAMLLWWAGISLYALSCVFRPPETKKERREAAAIFIMNFIVGVILIVGNSIGKAAP